MVQASKITGSDIRDDSSGVDVSRFSGFDPFWWLRAWLGAANAFSAGMAPQALTQSILPRWSLISVNETNSSAPETERRIVAGDSYGRQLGYVLDALGKLVDERPAGAPQAEAFVKLNRLRERVEAAKDAAAEARLNDFIPDLRRMKARNRARYDVEIETLKKLINEQAGDYRTE